MWDRLLVALGRPLWLGVDRNLFGHRDTVRRVVAEGFLKVVVVDRQAAAFSAAENDRSGLSAVGAVQEFFRAPKI